MSSMIGMLSPELIFLPLTMRKPETRGHKARGYALCDVNPVAAGFMPACLGLPTRPVYWTDFASIEFLWKTAVLLRGLPRNGYDS